MKLLFYRFLIQVLMDCGPDAHNYSTYHYPGVEAMNLSLQVEWAGQLLLSPSIEYLLC